MTKNLLGCPDAKTECRKCTHLKRDMRALSILFIQDIDRWICCKTQTPQQLTGDERLHINEVGCMSFEEEPAENRVKVL
jgi:hypothetical protein